MSIKSFFDGLFKKKAEPTTGSFNDLDLEIAALYRLLADTMGSEKLVIKAGKMDAVTLMRSQNRGERVLALMRILEEDPLITPAPHDEEIPTIINHLTGKIAQIFARRSIEEQIDKKVSEKIEKDHEDYVEDIRKQILADELPNYESAHDAKKRKDFERLDSVRLTKSVMELLRPQSFDEIVGQERAVKSLMAKLSSPYPQHLLLYGPPGVGKTTAARLVLEVAKQKMGSPFAADAPFVETDGTVLRWDPRDMTNPLLGSVHDPIYQGAQKAFADSGIPEPKPGMVTEAHGGILFIDEIGEMDEMLQNKLLKVLEDKRVFFESAYYDPDDSRVPPYIRTLFDKGAPADFVLIGATTREPQHINSALRSRCAEIYFEPLTPAHISKIIDDAAVKLKVTLEDGVPELISEYSIEGRKAINILADSYSLALDRLEDELLAKEKETAAAPKKQENVSRETIPLTQNNPPAVKTAPVWNLSRPTVDSSRPHIKSDVPSEESFNLAAALNREPTVAMKSIAADVAIDMPAVSKDNSPGNKDAAADDAENDSPLPQPKQPIIPEGVVVTKKDVYEVTRVSRLHQFGRHKASNRPTIGKIFGLGVSGFLGSVIEIETVVFPAAEKGKGKARFNDTAGSMAKDSVFNATSVTRAITGKDLSDYDIHVNIIGGGNIDGPSAGVAILATIISAITGSKIRQDVAVTGEISLQGWVKPVGGVFEKAYGAKQAGIRTIVIPKENEKDIPEAHLGLRIFPVETARDAFAIIFADDKWLARG